MNEHVTVDECRAWATSSERPPAVFRHVDLRDVTEFESGSFDDCLFLSCELTPAQAGYLTSTGATVIGDDGVYPYDLHRRALYTADELFAGFSPDAPNGYDATYDAGIYRHWQATGGQHPPSIAEGLARRLHDFSITEALHDRLVGAEPVAIMGGHGLERGAPGYATVASIARTLARDGKLLLSGGGPGAMEAAHLGAWFARRDDAEMSRAIADVLAPRPTGAAPGKEYADPDWLHRAIAVRERWPAPAGSPLSIGIPTWVYGHEPPAAFATLIAKYFANSVREEGLLAVATHGVIFTPGSAGTIQEIFQDLTQNHYATFGWPSPMVLLGVEYWTRRHPVFPVIESLAVDRGYRDLIVITDDPDEAIDAVRTYRRE